MNNLTHALDQCDSFKGMDKLIVPRKLTEYEKWLELSNEQLLKEVEYWKLRAKLAQDDLQILKNQR